MQNNENHYEGAEREERKKNKQIAKKNLVRGHSFMTPTKKTLKLISPLPSLAPSPFPYP